MIEVNKLAKPYNPCESVLGLDLLSCFSKTQLIGSSYYLHKVPEGTGKDVLALVNLSVSFSLIERKVKALGWKRASLDLSRFSVYKVGNSLLFITSRQADYLAMGKVAELMKYLNMDGLPVEDRHTHAIDIYKIVVDGDKVKLNTQGQFTGLGSALVDDVPYWANPNEVMEDDHEPIPVTPMNPANIPTMYQQQGAMAGMNAASSVNELPNTIPAADMLGQWLWPTPPVASQQNAVANAVAGVAGVPGIGNDW